MIIQGLKKNKIELSFFVLFSFIFYYSTYVLKGYTFLSEDDLAHTILKPQTLFNCFKSNCEGISFFLKNINDEFAISDYKLIERQIHRIASQYTFLTDFIYYLFFLIFKNWNQAVISMIFFTSIFKFIGLIGITNIFFTGKLKTIFFIFFSTVFISTPGFEPHWGQNLTAYFFLISLSLIYFNNNSFLKIIFFILTLLSHANGIVLASVLVLSNFFIKYETNKNFFKNINSLDLILGSLIIISYFFYYFVNLDSGPPQSLYIPEGNYLSKNIYLIYNYFKIIPPASAGIIFMVFIIVYLMVNSFDKKINLILISIAIIYFLVIFTGSAFMIFKKSIFLFTSIFYICFFYLFFSIMKNVNVASFKQLIFYQELSLQRKINLVLFIPLTLILVTILENFLIDNPKKFYRSHISGSINNHNLEAYDKLISQLDTNKIIFSGSEAGIYYAINTGLYKRRFVWSELKNNKMPPGMYNYIFNSRIHAGGRTTSNKNVYQFYNSIVLNKNNKLILNLSELYEKPKKIILGFKKIDYKKDSYVKISFNGENKIVKVIENEILLENDMFDLNQLILSTKNNLILTRIQLDDQSTNWPYNLNLSLRIKGEVYTHKDDDFFSKENKFVKFDELEILNFQNCKLIEIINDEFTLNFAKVECT
ncbi:hypothetical protein OAZ11_02135 [Candidatus Pelagibacter sp.]|nr:hypothetical protein [Candidatus Pelagibacter sp.]